MSLRRFSKAASRQFEPRVDRPLGVVLVRRGIAEKEQDDIPETAGDKPAVATGDLREAVLKGGDRSEQILEIRSRRHAPPRPIASHDIQLLAGRPRFSLDFSPWKWTLGVNLGWEWQ
jgi:hypothetical protein